MIAALLVGFVAGSAARLLIPFDTLRNLHGPKSWGVSIAIGCAGAIVGWLIFAVGLGWGDNNIFDWGSIIGSIIGAVIVLMVVNWYLRVKRIAT
jgi:uncharacterized membrane protein YeaQ/YmgE (transglycosylase-associated protein family)